MIPLLYGVPGCFLATIWTDSGKKSANITTQGDAGVLLGRDYGLQKPGKIIALPRAERKNTGKMRNSAGKGSH